MYYNYYKTNITYTKQLEKLQILNYFLQDFFFWERGLQVGKGRSGTAQSILYKGSQPNSQMLHIVHYLTLKKQYGNDSNAQCEQIDHCLFYK